MAARAPEFITTTAAARIAGLSQQAMTRRLKTGELTWYRNPTDHRMRLIDVDELKKYMAPKRRSEREEVSAP
jgi:hypothetical protein